MIPLRIMPIMLIDKNRVVKTQKYLNPRYIGDPINSAKIYNDKDIDELIILDITASKNKTQPNFELIKDISEEVFCPLSYGGGIKTLKEAEKIFSLGIEKIIINKMFYEEPSFVNELVKEFGSQSVSISIDLVNEVNCYSVYNYLTNKTRKISIDEILELVKTLKIGEIIVNSVSLEGTLEGFDLNLMEKFKEVNCQVVYNGGINDIVSLSKAISQTNISAFGVGKLFTFVKESVLLSYVDFTDRDILIKSLENKYV